MYLKCSFIPVPFCEKLRGQTECTSESLEMLIWQRKVENSKATGSVCNFLDWSVGLSQALAGRYQSWQTLWCILTKAYYSVPGKCLWALLP